MWSTIKRGKKGFETYVLSRERAMLLILFVLVYIQTYYIIKKKINIEVHFYGNNSFECEYDAILIFIFLLIF